ncbi:MAG: hypothetical protein JXB88_11345 [Spirochaetales bacterium]|nr:hypothetical protein [Spirochaetales bacterium]
MISAWKDEIKSTSKVDYSTTRKPQIEIVSFNKCFIPIIQFDVSGDYESLKALREAKMKEGNASTISFDEVKKEIGL